MSLIIRPHQQEETAKDNMFCLKIIKVRYTKRHPDGHTVTPVALEHVEARFGARLKARELKKANGKESKKTVYLDEQDPENPLQLGNGYIHTYALQGIENAKDFAFSIEKKPKNKTHLQLWLAYIPAGMKYFSGDTPLGAIKKKQPKKWVKGYASEAIIMHRQITSVEELQQLIDHTPTHLTMPHNILAFDFEAVYYSHSSRACSLGIAQFIDGELTLRKNFINQPPNNYYDPVTPMIHHLEPKDTANAPTFDKIWPKVKPYFDEADVILYHSNSPFDPGVLKAESEAYQLGIDLDKYTFASLFDVYPYKLEAITKAYHQDTSHHHESDDDAYYCGWLYVQHLKGNKPLEDIKPINDKLKQPYANVFVNHPTLKGDLLIKDLKNADPNSPYYDKKVVITGVFYQGADKQNVIDRIDIARQLKACGADIDLKVSEATDFVFVGKEAGAAKLRNIKKYGIKTLGQKDVETLMKIKIPTKKNTK